MQHLPMQVTLWWISAIQKNDVILQTPEVIELCQEYRLHTTGPSSQILQSIHVLCHDYAATAALLLQCLNSFSLQKKKRNSYYKKI